VREEVWVDEGDLVVRYNLAFLLPHRLGADNGRVLGFDNAHGVHERHYMGDVRRVSFHKLRGNSKALLQGSSSTQESL
jgi:hypothetical protein